MNKELEQEIKVLAAQGVPAEQVRAYVEMKMLSSRQPEMSRTDGVVMSQNEGNVPGAYIDAYQQSQDVFGEFQTQVDRMKALQTSRAELLPPQAPINPNYRVVTEGQNMTVGPNGQIVYY